MAQPPPPHRTQRFAIAGALGTLVALVCATAGAQASAADGILAFDPVVAPWLLAGLGAALLGASAWLVRLATKHQRGAAMMGPEALVGRLGVAISEVAPDGFVRVEGEIWSAHAGAGAVSKGDEVQVVRATGVTLEVIRA